MKTMRQLMEAVSPIPADPYGYWIMPDGRIIPCAVQAHITSACQQLGEENYDPDEDDEGEENFRIRHRAVEEGGIRVLWEAGQTVLNAELGDPTKPGLQALIRIIQTNKAASSYRIEWDYSEKTFSRYGEAIRYLRENLRDF